MANQVIELSDIRRAPVRPGRILLTDPPYSDFVHSNSVSTSVFQDDRVSHFNGRNRDYGFASLDQETFVAAASWIEATDRWSLVFTDTKLCATWNALPSWRRDVLWRRWSSPIPGNRKPPHVFEIISTFHPFKSKTRWNGEGDWLGPTAKCLRGDSKFSAQKPLDLILELIVQYADPQDDLRDPFGGSCTTAVAGWLLDREVWCGELDPATVDLARDRLAIIRAGGMTNGELERVARFLARFPDWVDLCMARLGKPLQRALDAEVRRLERQAREEVLAILADDAAGDRKLESLVKSLYPGSPLGKKT